MNDWGDDYYGSYYTGEAMAYLIYFFVLITPVIPAGDIGIILVKSATNEHPKIIYLILAWRFSVWIYYHILESIYAFIEDYIPYFIFLMFSYAQGIFFASLLVKSDNAILSKYVINSVVLIYGFFTSEI